MRQGRPPSTPRRGARIWREDGMRRCLGTGLPTLGATRRVVPAAGLGTGTTEAREAPLSGSPKGGGVYRRFPPASDCRPRPVPRPRWQTVFPRFLWPPGTLDSRTRRWAGGVATFPVLSSRRRTGSGGTAGGPPTLPVGPRRPTDARMLPRCRRRGRCRTLPTRTGPAGWSRQDRRQRLLLRAPAAGQPWSGAGRGIRWNPPAKRQEATGRRPPRETTASVGERYRDPG